MLQTIFLKGAGTSSHTLIFFKLYYWQYLLMKTFIVQTGLDSTREYIDQKLIVVMAGNKSC